MIYDISFQLQNEFNLIVYQWIHVCIMYDVKLCKSKLLVECYRSFVAVVSKELNAIVFPIAEFTLGNIHKPERNKDKHFDVS